MTQPPVLAKLETALLDAIEADQRRSPVVARRLPHRRWILSAGVGVAACGLGLGLLPFGSDDQPPPYLVDAARAEVSVTHEQDRLRVTIGNPGADDRDLQAALDAAGVTAEVHLVPASPSLVGDLVASANRATEDVGYEERNPGQTDDAVVLTLPLHPEAPIELWIGRTARPGEHYASSALSAEAPGEELHCVPVQGSRITEARRLLDAAGVRAVWRSPDNDETTPGDLDPGFYVHTVTPWAAGEVLVMTSEQQPRPGAPWYEESLRAGCPDAS